MNLIRSILTRSNLTRSNLTRSNLILTRSNRFSMT
ncbi:MAG: pentapeptide repeat-containing protein [Culicoidibacterales bacterium]